MTSNSPKRLRAVQFLIWHTLAGGILALAVHSAGVDAQTLSPSGSVRIAVIKSLDLPEYNLAYEGFINKLTETGHKPSAVSYVLGRTDSVNESLFDKIATSAPDLILALGTRAARDASKYLPRIPIIYSMVLAPPDDAKAASPSNMTGSVLSIPLETQIDEIQHTFPTLKHIGIISDPSRTRETADSVKELCRSKGLEAHIAWAKGEEAVPDAVRSLKDSIQVLWMIPDETVLTPRSSRYIIFELIKSGVPVIGLSSAYVKAGALMSLDCDYSDIGRQSAELAVRVLAGQKPGQLPHAIPRMFTRSVNLKIIEHVRIPIDQTVVDDSNAVTY